MTEKGLTVPVRSFFQQLLDLPVIDVVEILVIYVVIVTVVVGVLYVLEPVSSLEEFDYEMREFVHYYKETAYWWLTTFFVSVVSLTIGSNQSMAVDIALLSIFVAPAVLYYHRHYPFSLVVEYRARTSLGQTAISEEKENISTLDRGMYVLEFPITTGSNVSEFEISLDIPGGVDVWSYSGITGVELSEDKNAIVGKAPAGKDSFVIELILDKKSGVQQGANQLVLSDASSGRELTTVRLMP